MYLESLILTNFRNFRSKKITFPKKCIVIEGKNGVGKTNILESIYLLCTGKSQKKSKISDMVNFDSNFFFIEGNFFFVNGCKLNVAVSFGKEKTTTYLLDNKKVNSFISWFGCRPVLSFNSEDINLIYGAPEVRRKFIDIIGSFFDNSYLRSLIEYNYWVSLKNHLLFNNFDRIQCDLYDEKIANFGTEIIFKRYYIIKKLREKFSYVYTTIFNDQELVDLIYESSPIFSDSSLEFCKNVFYDTLQKNRKRDQRIGYSSVGPQKDNLLFLLNGRKAKNFSSQGQGRSLSLSLKLSASNIIEEHFKESIIYLLDDSIYELDSLRTKNFFPYLKNCGQVFIASPEGKQIYDKDFYYMNISND